MTVVTKGEVVVIKISGEALRGDDDVYDDDFLEQLAQEVARASVGGYKIVIVVGGGNIWRGARGKASGMDPSDADYMGMLATLLNALRLGDALEKAGVACRVMNALDGPKKVCEDYIRKRALRHLDKGRVVILAGGTGNPHVTTDYAGALRARELRAAIYFKGTHSKVDGVYEADPRVDPTARRFSTVSFREVQLRELAVMDDEAIGFCRREGLPLRVFNIMQPGSLGRALLGEAGTLITKDCEAVFA